MGDMCSAINFICIKTTLRGMEKMQCMVGNFLLQPPMSTLKVATWCESGLMPLRIAYRLLIKAEIQS